MSKSTVINSFSVSKLTWWGMILLAVAGTSMLRLWLVLADGLPFNSDEAIVALMARHILIGKGVPVFFYGQAYMGSLDALLVALGFAVFGQHVWVIRLVQTILYAGVLVTGSFLARRITGSQLIGILTALLLMIPNVNALLYTSVSLGGYVEALLLGNLILLVGLILRDADATHRVWWWLCLGLLSGFGLWVFGITLIFSLGTLIYLVGWQIRVQRALWKRIAFDLMLFIVGAIIGLAPVIWFMSQFGVSIVVQELAGSAISGITSTPLLFRIPGYLLSFLLLGVPVIMGIRPPWEIRWILLPVIPLIIYFWIGAVLNAIKPRNRRLKVLTERSTLLHIVLAINLFGFILTPFGADPSGRYFLPMLVPLTIIGALFILHLAERWRPLLWILPLLITGYHLYGSVESVYLQKTGLTTQFDAVTRINHQYDQQLIQFLSAEQLHYGYSNYWVSYPLAFLSQEQLVYIPALPYHQDFRYTPRDHRYLLYEELVAGADKIAYITTNHAPLDNYLRQQFLESGLLWKEHKIGDYQIFYNLTRPIRPLEMNLGIQK